MEATKKVAEEWLDTPGAATAMKEYVRLVKLLEGTRKHIASKGRNPDNAKDVKELQVRIRTADEIISTFLTEWLIENHPALTNYYTKVAVFDHARNEVSPKGDNE